MTASLSAESIAAGNYLGKQSAKGKGAKDAKQSHELHEFDEPEEG